MPACTRESADAKARISDRHDAGGFTNARGASLLLAATTILALMAGCSRTPYVVVAVSAAEPLRPLEVTRLEVDIISEGQPMHVTIDKPLVLDPDQDFALRFDDDRVGEVHVTVKAVRSDGPELAPVTGTVDIVPHGVARLELVLGKSKDIDGGMPDGGTPDLAPLPPPPPIKFASERRVPAGPSPYAPWRSATSIGRRPRRGGHWRRASCSPERGPGRLRNTGRIRIRRRGHGHRRCRFHQ